ncbi:hypothetical protein DB346_05370 [Verrucomicrobia bacterium LW23]|nr:hypothetical protein DB346_05370 [Verrucomicrobia bacterium LW23]
MKSSSLCVTAFCRNKRGKKKGKLCNKCALRIWRAKYPLKAAYLTLKTSAVKRRIAFLLTLKEFGQAIYGTEYLERKGWDSNALHIDRIDNSLGYQVGNIRVVTAHENCRKGRLFERRDSVLKCEIINGAECPY